MFVRTVLWVIYFLVGAAMSLCTLLFWVRFTSGSILVFAGLLALNGVAIALMGKYDFERKAACTGAALFMTAVVAYSTVIPNSTILASYGALAVTVSAVVLAIVTWVLVGFTTAFTRYVLRMKDRDPPEGGNRT